jgi:hypothetical protein
MIQKVEITKTKNEGVEAITAPDWNGKVLRMSHEAYRRWREKGDVPKTAAVYALYADHFDKTAYGKELYIGQSGEVDSRLDSHVGAKHFWNRVLIFVSALDWMNIAFARNIENEFILMAKRANRYQVENGNDGATTWLGNEDQQKLDAFLAGILPVLQLANIDIFNLNLDGTYQLIETGFGGKVFTSTLRIEPCVPQKQVRILAGSQFSSYWEDRLKDAGLAGIVQKSDAQAYEATADIVVSLDESRILPRLLGTSLEKWRTPCGVSLKEVLFPPK